MAISIPAHIECLEGRPRRVAIHQWRADVHRKCRNWGIVALIAIIVIGDLASISSIITAFLAGMAVMFVAMHELKVTFHAELAE